MATHDEFWAAWRHDQLAARWEEVKYAELQRFRDFVLGHARAIALVSLNASSEDAMLGIYRGALFAITAEAQRLYDEDAAGVTERTT